MRVADPVEPAIEIPRKVWTRDEAYALGDLGFPNAEKWGLIEGELIDRNGKKRSRVVWQDARASVITYRSDQAIAPFAAPDFLFCLDRVIL